MNPRVTGASPQKSKGDPLTKSWRSDSAHIYKKIVCETLSYDISSLRIFVHGAVDVFCYQTRDRCRGGCHLFLRGVWQKLVQKRTIQARCALIYFFYRIKKLVFKKKLKLFEDTFFGDHWDPWGGSRISTPGAFVRCFLYNANPFINVLLLY